MKFTVAEIAALKTTKPNGVRVYDETQRGLGLVVMPSGSKRWFVRYGSRTTRKTMYLGTFPEMKPEDARSAAQEVLVQAGAAARGAEGIEDPLVAKRKRTALSITYGDAVRQRLEFVRIRSERLRSKRGLPPHPEFVRGTTRRWFPPSDTYYLLTLGKPWINRPLNSISSKEIEARREQIASEIKAKGPRVVKARQKKMVNAPGEITRNRFLSYLRAFFNWAINNDMVSVDPCRRVGRNRQDEPEEEARHRTLTEDEETRLLKALSDEGPFEENAVLLALETGARMSDVCFARWENFHLDDIENASWIIPRAKSNRKDEIGLRPDTARRLLKLRRLNEAGPKSNFILPQKRDPSKPRANFTRGWDAVATRAKLPDAVYHDLRRTFGRKVRLTHPIDTVAVLLRSTTIEVVRKHYAFLNIDDQRKAVRALPAVVPFKKTRARRKRAAE